MQGNKEPDFINEEGVKWWKDDHTTNYAQRPDLCGTTLPEIVAWKVEFPDGVRTLILVNNEKGIPIYENQTLEGVGVHIDMLKFLKRDADAGTD